jgi:hypothetical protein
MPPPILPTDDDTTTRNTKKGDNELASAVLSGTILGNSLRRALESLVREEQHHHRQQQEVAREEENGASSDDSSASQLSITVDPSSSINISKRIDCSASSTTKTNAFNVNLRQGIYHRYKRDDNNTDQIKQNREHHDKNVDSCDDNESHHESLTLDERAMDQIWTSFRDSVAATSTYLRLPQQKEAKENEKEATPPAQAPRPPPRALLRGRCQSYNRFAKNWLVSIDHVQLRERRRRPTSTTNIKIQRKRKRTDHVSLWDRETTKTSAPSQQEIVVLNSERKVQILAYGDTG